MGKILFSNTTAFSTFFKPRHNSNYKAPLSITSPVMDCSKNWVFRERNGFPEDPTVIPSRARLKTELTGCPVKRSVLPMEMLSCLSEGNGLLVPCLVHSRALSPTPHACVRTNVTVGCSVTSALSLDQKQKEQRRQEPWLLQPLDDQSLQHIFHWEFRSSVSSLSPVHNSLNLSNFSYLFPRSLLSLRWNKTPMDSPDKQAKPCYIKLPKTLTIWVIRLNPPQGKCPQKARTYTLKWWRWWCCGPGKNNWRSSGAWDALGHASQAAGLASLRCRQVKQQLRPSSAASF